MWKKWATWFKGAIIGLVIALILNIILFNNNINIGVLSCNYLTSCSGSVCEGCYYVGIMLNLTYGFIIGAFIGWLMDKIKNKKPGKEIKKKRKGNK